MWDTYMVVDIYGYVLCLDMWFIGLCALFGYVVYSVYVVPMFGNAIYPVMWYIQFGGIFGYVVP